jgi:hypothetical protein
VSQISNFTVSSFTAKVCEKKAVPMVDSCRQFRHPSIQARQSELNFETGDYLSREMKCHLEFDELALDKPKNQAGLAGAHIPEKNLATQSNAYQHRRALENSEP